MSLCLLRYVETANILPLWFKMSQKKTIFFPEISNCCLFFLIEISQGKKNGVFNSICIDLCKIPQWITGSIKSSPGDDISFPTLIHGDP